VGLKQGPLGLVSRGIIIVIQLRSHLEEKVAAPV
jgi:hypothetical protein